MKTVHQHPDGSIFVRVDDTTYMDTPTNFESDFGYPLPALPEGMTERIYEQGRRHVLAGETADGVVTMGDEMPWPMGDQTIGNIQAGLNGQAARAAAEAAEKVALEPEFDMGGTTSEVIGS